MLNLVDKIKNLNYEKIIKEIQNTDDWKKFHSLKFYKEHVKNNKDIFLNDKLLPSNSNKILTHILNTSQKDISYNKKTLEVIKDLRKLFISKKFALNLNSASLPKNKLTMSLIHNPFMFYKENNKREELMDLFLKDMKKYEDEKEFLYGVGCGSIDDDSIMILGMAPGFYNGNEYDELSKPFKPSFYFANTSKLLRFAMKDHIKDLYFTNVSKIVFSKERMNESVYKKLYNDFYKVLQKEIKIIKPKVIIALGNNVSEFLTEKKIDHIKGYHPSYFIYQHSSQKSLEYYKNLIDSVY